MIKRLLITIVCVLFLMPLSLATRTPASRHWEAAFFGGGGTFPYITSDYELDDVKYLTSDVSGFLKTINGGDDWSFMNSGVTTIINTALAQSEYNPDILFGLGNKLIKSIDRGKHWFPLADYKGTRGKVNKPIAIGRTNPNLVFVALDNGKIMKSTDGLTFTQYAIPFGTNIYATFLYLDKTDQHLVVGSAANDMKIYDLSDDSVSDIVLSGTNANRVWDFDTYVDGSTEYLCVGAGFRVACSADSSNFTSWDYTEDAYNNASFMAYRIAVKKLSNSNIRYMAYMRRVSGPGGATPLMRSVDSGSTWADVTGNVTVNTTDNPTQEWATFGNLGNIGRLHQDRRDEDVVWVLTDWTVWKSTDGGVNWVEKVKGAQNTVGTGIAVTPNGWWIATFMDIGAYISKDKGQTWQPLIPNTSNGSPQGFAVAGWYWQPVVLGTKAEWDAGQGVVIIPSSQWSDFVPRIVRSEDSAQTFEVVSGHGLPTTLLNYRESLTDPNYACWGMGIPRAIAKSKDESIVYLGIDGRSSTEYGGIFYSTDKGKNWTRTATQPPTWRVYNALAVDPTDPTGNTVIFSEWFQVSGSQPHTYKSTDRGATWNTVSANIGDFDMTYLENGNVIKVGLNNGPSVDFSTNGNSWSTIKVLNETQQIADGLACDPQDSNHCIVGINDGTNTGPTSAQDVSSSTQIIGDSVWESLNIQAGSQADWINITGDLPVPAGVQAIAFDRTVSPGWLIIQTDGAAIFSKSLAETEQITVEGIEITP